MCNVNHAGNAICTCQPGLIPKPDTITGCGPECVRDPDCQTGYVCQSQRCVVKPDVSQRKELFSRYFTDNINLPALRPVPLRSWSRVYSDQVWQRHLQVSARPHPQPRHHHRWALLSPRSSLHSLDVSGCKPECVRDPDCSRGFICQNQKCVEEPDPCDPSPCGPGAECSLTRSGNAICRCQPGLIPNPDTITGGL